MSAICISGAPSFSYEDAHLRSALASVGHTLVDEQDLASQSADLLIYFAPPDVPPRDVLHWLSIVNRVSTDAVVVDGYRCSLPAQRLIALGDVALGTNADHMAEQVTHLNANPGVPALPRLVKVPDGLTATWVASDQSRLANLLGDPTTRAGGISDGLMRILSGRHIDSRQAYDLSRYLRWSQKHLDKSFVKLRLALAGADAANAFVGGSANSLGELIADSRTSELVVLLGAPGSGKSMQLQHFEVTNALNSIRAGSDGSVPIAFCINLGEHGASPTRDPFAWMAERWKNRVLEMSMQPLKVWVDEGRMTFLMDAFNEIASTEQKTRREWMLRWQSCITQELLERLGNRVVVACRQQDLTISLGTTEIAPTHVLLEPLTASEVDAIARRYSTRAADDLARATAADPDLINLYQTPYALTDYLKFASGPVPSTQGEIFWRRIAGVLEREQKARNHRMIERPWITDRAVARLQQANTLGQAVAAMRSIPLLGALGAMARQMTQSTTETTSHRTSLDPADALAILATKLDVNPVTDGMDVLMDCFDLELLLQRDDLIKFQHQSLQDFFAAMAIAPAEILDGITISDQTFEARLGALEGILDSLGPGDELPMRPHTGYEEIFARACEIRPDLAGQAVRLNPWLAADQIVRRPSAPDAGAVRSQVLAELELRLGQMSDIRERIANLTTVGLLRMGETPVPFDQLLPTVAIPAGTWQIGCGEATGQAVKSARPTATVSLAAFKIGLYPVTNREYRRFIDDGGYQDRAFWSDEGWTWRSGRFPLDDMITRWRSRRDEVASTPNKAVELLRDGLVSVIEAAAVARFGRMADSEIERVARDLVGVERTGSAFASSREFLHPSQPVVGVCWHEASAYCSWLSSRTGAPVRIPSEDEWEVAALHRNIGLAQTLDDISVPVDWDVPWGNTAELHVGRPTPVGSFNIMNRHDVPQEMSGNVFEWVTDLVTAGEDWRRVVKGGSFRHLMRRAHPAYRGQGDTTTRNDDNAFRIAMT